MGKIYKNGTQYSGSTNAASNINYDNTIEGVIAAGNIQGAIDEIITSTSKTKVLTQAEYDALPSSKYTDNIEYFITDAKELSAENIKYDNTESGLESTNVQDALDEVSVAVAGYWTVEYNEGNLKFTRIASS